MTERIGRSAKRVDATDKVTGRALYTADIKMPNLAHGKILGSSIAHGRIKKIDTSKAEALEGVLAVITGRVDPSSGGRRGSPSQWARRYRS